MFTTVPLNGVPVGGSVPTPFAQLQFPMAQVFPGLTGAMPGESSLLGMEAQALQGMSSMMPGSLSGVQGMMGTLMQGFLTLFMLEMMKKLVKMMKKLMGKGQDKGGGGAASALQDSLGSFLGAPSGSSSSAGATGSAGSSSRASAPGGSAAVDASGHAFPVAGIKPGTKINTHWGSGERGGTDIFAPAGTPVFSICNGTVESAGNSPISGNKVTIKGDDGLTYFYCHLQEAPMVSSGQKVKAGTQIGKVGDTGNAKGTGAHLHLGIGHGIISGTGPRGGVGSNFDAVSFLEKILNGK